jgi:hypothetical protein
MEVTAAISGLLEKSRSNPADFEASMLALNEKFRVDGQRKVPSEDPISLAALARHIHYLALSPAEQKRKKTTTHLRPSWAHVVHLYDKFRERVGPDLFLDPAIKAQDLMRFCSFDTRRRGSGSKVFYSSLAVLLVDLVEQGKFASEFVNFALPPCEWGLADAVRQHLLEGGAKVRSTSPSRGTRTFDTEGTSKFPEFGLKFAYAPAKLNDLRAFHNSFRSESSDLGVHFICYRPRKSDPNELMKTFLAIMPPEAHEDSTSFNFVHIYQAPNTTTKQRIALGKVLPLHEGLYLVGGQKETQTPLPSGPTPFRTLKVISMAWRSIEVFDHLLSGLVMSANNQGEHIVSRIALKATPLDHSSKVKLGAIGLHELADDLKEDMKKEIAFLDEKGAPPPEFDRFELQRDAADMEAASKRLAMSIAGKTNNDPTVWDLPEGISAKKPKQPTLTKAMVGLNLEEIFGSDGRPRYTDNFGKNFEFWSSIRFGVLARK